MNDLSADVIVIGSGAGGAAVAGELARCGASVLVLEAGPPLTNARGAHVRNRDVSDAGIPAFLDYLWSNYAPHNPGDTFLEAMPGLGCIQGIGGMLTCWTNNCPTHDVSELPAWLQLNAWDELVQRAQQVLGVTQTLSALDPRSIGITNAIRSVVSLPPGRDIQPMPIAGRLNADGMHYPAADDLFRGAPAENLNVRPNWVARRLESSGGRVTGVRAWSADAKREERFTASAIVVAAGSVGSAQLLAASDIGASPALGRYITEHALIGTRVLLREELRHDVPPGSPTFAVWLPASVEHPWSSQVTRHPIPYSTTLPPGHDETQTADIIALCPVEPREENRLDFDLDRLDAHGLPSVIGRLELSKRDKTIAADALREQFLIANEIGDLAIGWSSQLLARGGSTHVMGSCRMGDTDDGTSVVDPDGRVWNHDNLYVAGNGVLGTANAGNPTLTMIAYALRTADAILGRTGTVLSHVHGRVEAS